MEKHTANNTIDRISAIQRKSHRRNSFLNMFFVTRNKQKNRIFVVKVISNTSRPHSCIVFSNLFTRIILLNFWLDVHFWPFSTAALLSQIFKLTIHISSEWMLSARKIKISCFFFFVDQNRIFKFCFVLTPSIYHKNSMPIKYHPVGEYNEPYAEYLFSLLYSPS